MIKQITEFLVTGIAVVTFYLLYFVTMVVLTVLLGLPISLGIKVIIDCMKVIFTN